MAFTPADVCPNPLPCGALLKALRGRGGVARATNHYNIGEGHLTADVRRLTAESASRHIMRKERTVTWYMYSVKTDSR